MTSTEAVTRTILSRAEKTERKDIEVHTCLLVTEFGKYIDIREYVVSLDSYGRGITFPFSTEDSGVFETVLSGLEALG